MNSTAQARTKSAATSAREQPCPFSNKQLLQIYRTMRLSRVLDERMWTLNRQGRAPFVISCQGHEATQVGSALALQPGIDVAFPYYRDVGVVLTLGMTARDLMLAFFAKAADPSSGGRQMPNHFGSARHRIITGSSPVSTQIPQAVGAALAAKIRREPSVVAAYLGEGSTASGHFHEGLNFAGIHRVPVIVVCENNGWAISVPRMKGMPVRTVAERAAAYNIPGICVDGTDLLAVYDAMKTAVDRAREGGGPTLIDAQTHRMTPHSSDDDDKSYRPPDDLDEARRRDPMARFRSFLIERQVLDQAIDEDITRSVREEVDEAVEFAEASPEPRPEDLTRHVFA